MDKIAKDMRDAPVSVDGSWRSGSRLDGGVTSLRFSGLVTLNLGLFVDLEQAGIVGAAPKNWAKDMRISLDVDNLLDTRTTVSAPSGMVPAAFQRAYLDPLGRTVRISLRKQF